MNPRLRPYPIQIVWSDDDQAFAATIPPLKKLIAFGNSPEEALRELTFAADAWLWGVDASGHPFPPGEGA